MWIATPVTFSHSARSGAQRDMGYRANAATPPRRKSAVSQGDAAKLTAGLRCAGLPWGPPRLHRTRLAGSQFR
ncbi:MAG: hypothetical protein K0U74_17070, partial [Alphaproteobacteria bacterium]|nr:hypothetical protein [Alphaproteobacteria bacterium]